MTARVSLALPAAVVGAGAAAALAVSSPDMSPLVPFMLVALAALAVVAYQRPLWALCLGILAIPLENAAGAGGPSPTLGILGVTGAAWMLRWAAARPLRLVPDGALIAFAGVMLAHLPGLALAPEPQIVLIQVVNWGVLLLLFHFIVTDGSLRTVRGVTLAFVVSAGAAGLQALVWPNAVETATFGGQAVQRAVGVFGSPNALGIFLAMAIPVQVAYVLRGPARWRPVAAVCLAIAAVALAATVSRGSIMGLAVGLLVLACWAPFRRAAALALALVVAVVALGPASLAAPITGGQVAERLTNTTRTAATDPRADLYRAVPRMVADNPIFGVGALEFGHFAPQYGLPVDLGIITHAHNVWLTVAAELGLVGLAAFLAFTASIALAARRAIRTLRGFERALAFALAASMAAVAAESLVDYAFSTRLVAVEFFLLAACLAALARIRPPRPQPHESAP